MKRLQRTLFVFAVVTMFVFVAGLIYHHFGRGMFSQYMDHAFYYPLFFGLYVNMMLLSVQRRLPFVGTVGYRLYSNVYNTGIGALTLYSFVMGVLEIAAAESGLIQYLAYLGWACIAIGLCSLIILLVLSWNARKHYDQSQHRQRQYSR